MKPFTRIPLLSNAWPLTLALMFVGLSHLTADDADVILFVDPEPAVKPAPVAVRVEVIQAAGKPQAASKVVRLAAPILYPTIYPNPLAFNMAWVSVSDKTFTRTLALANRNKLGVQRGRIAAAVKLKQPNQAAQNAIQLQMRKLLEPMLKSELSFAVRVTDVNPTERRKLAADGKAWFEKFLVDFLKNQDPNQQQMLLQGMQGVWFANGRQSSGNPRDAIHLGVTKLVNESLSKEKQTKYALECRKRTEFAQQVAVDSLVERIDEKVKLSPEQWKKITKSLHEHWDTSQEPPLETFVVNQSMWPGAPVQWVIPELSPAQQAVLKRVNAMSNRIFFGGGGFGQIFGVDNDGLDDMDDDAAVEVAQPAPAAAPENPFE
jgi:hypothetical protein